MIELFTRSGEKVQVAEGVKSISRPKPCGRCGGAGGSDKWAHTGWTCYDCGGKRFLGTVVLKLYSAEKLAKLNEARDKRYAVKAAAAAEKAAKMAAEAEARKEAFLAANAALIKRAAPYMVTEEGREPGFIARVMEKALAQNSITEGQAAAVTSAIDKIEEQARVRQASRHVGKVGQRIEMAVKVDSSTGRMSEILTIRSWSLWSRASPSTTTM